MGTAIHSNYANVQKTKYDSRIRKFFSETTGLLNLMKEGKYIPHTGEADGAFTLTMQTQLPEGIAWNNENDDVPTALNEAWIRSTLGWQKLVGTVAFTQEVLGMKGSHMMVDPMKNKMKGLVTAFKKNLDAAAHGSGTAGLATCVSVSSAGATDTVTVDATKYLRVGMVLDGYDASNNQDANGITVDVIASATTFETEDADGVDSATVLYNEGSHSGSGTNSACNGIANIVDDDAGSFQGLTRADYPMMMGTVLDGGTPGTPEALSKDRMIKILDKMANGDFLGYDGRVPDYGYGTPGVYNAFTSLYQTSVVPIERMVKKDGIPAGIGFDYHGTLIKIMASRYATASTLYLLNREHLLRYVDQMGWVNEGGLLNKIANKLAWDANYTAHLNFGSDYPRRNGRLNDITELYT